MSPEIISLMGGSALLVYSMEELSKSVQYLSGPTFRQWINTYAGTRIRGILLGLVMAIFLSGSGGVSVMVVGLANARLLTLEQVFSVLLGAAVGSTFIVHMFAFDFAHYGLLVVAFGVALTGLSRSDRLTRLARSMTFFGLLLFSLTLLVSSGKALEDDTLFRHFIEYFRNRPLISLLIAAGLTAIIQSSAATIAFVMSLIVTRHGTVLEAIPWVLGANLGSSATAVFASSRTGLLGRQAALGNFFFRFVGVVICYPLMEYLAEGATHFGGGVGRQIAISHTLFNVVLVVVCYPFIKYGVRFVRHMMPEGAEKGPFVFQYIDDRMLATPELALAQAQREILRLADTVEKMLENCIGLFVHGNQNDVEQLKAMDQVVDFLNRGIKLYLTKLSQTDMSPEQVQKEFELLLRTNDLENIGDIIDKNILELVRKKMKKGYAFSREGWNEIVTYHAQVLECLRISTAYFNSRDRALYAKLMVKHQQIIDMTIDFSEQHVQRLHHNVKESLDTTSVHLDLLGNLQRITDLAVNFTRVYGATVSDGTKG